MEHSLDDSLNLDSSMGVDFEQAEDIAVSNADISLESGSESVMPMEFEQIEEQPLLMDANSEEVIVPHFADQFSLQDFSITQSSGSGTIVEPHNVMSQSETMLDLQFTPMESMVSTSAPAKQITTITPVKQDVKIQPKLYAIKNQVPKANKKADTIRQPVAIAPKPAKVVPKQFAIAPKPVSVKKIPMTSFLQGNLKGTNLGKQIIMMPTPSGGTQKFKVITTNAKNLTSISNVQYIKAATPEQAQIIKTRAVNAQITKGLPKFVVQGQKSVEEYLQQPATLTKLVSAPGGKSRYIALQTNTVPNSKANKIQILSPSKQAMSIVKSPEIISLTSPTKQGKPQEIFAIKTTPKLVPATTQAITTKKVVITANPKHNVLKGATTTKNLQMAKDASLVNMQGQQMHQINVPGKGIQYIKLLSQNSSKPVQLPKAQPAASLPKTFFLTDSKGNVIQLAGEKSSAPPVVIHTNNPAAKKVPANPVQKFVRIAPVSNKSQTILKIMPRSTQSLLAPLSPGTKEQTVTKSVANDVTPSLVTSAEESYQTEQIEQTEQTEQQEEQTDSKAALRAFIADVVAEAHGAEVDVQFERHESQMTDESMQSIDQVDSRVRTEEHPLIVIPSSFNKHDLNSSDSQNDQNFASILDLEVERLPYPEENNSQELSENELSTELNLRLRKACNCTKSQCLKLYCDCFANGEFCNNCNCINCCNNLENEELRQRAIRGCLERNPNAFRPKIGKAKLGGPEIIRRHNKGCNCKRSGCLKNYCECYEARIACSAMCKCVGCRNVEDLMDRGRDGGAPPRRPHAMHMHTYSRQPCSFMTHEVIEAVCQCLLAAGVEGATTNDPDQAVSDPGTGDDPDSGADPVRDVLEEFARCLQEIIGASQSSPLVSVKDEDQA